MERVSRAIPVVVVMGARQTGKSTLVHTLPAFQQLPYLTLDDGETRALARSAPNDTARRAPRLILDEVQREPGLVLAIKQVVDSTRPRVPGQFIVTGSANLLLMSKIQETLAGRANYVVLWPLTRREQLGLGRPGIWTELFTTPVRDWYDLVRAQAVPMADWRTLVRHGGYPVPAYEMTVDDDRQTWFRGYVDTYLERDLQDLSAIGHLVEFRRLIKLASLRIGTVQNMTSLAIDAKLPQTTTRRYLDLLETSFQLIRVDAYAPNRSKRLIKSPKLYWSDAGLARYLADEPEPRGEHLENLVLTDLVAWRDGQVGRPQVLYWQTTQGAEVDFVVEHENQLLAVEVKATSRPSQNDTRHLRTFLDEYGRAVRGGLLLHTGDEVFWAADRILAAPWWRVI